MQHRYDYLFSSAMNIYKYLNIELTQLRHVIVGKEWCCTPHDNVNRLYITLDGEGALITESGTLTLQPYHIYLIPAKLPFPANVIPIWKNCMFISGFSSSRTRICCRSWITFWRLTAPGRKLKGLRRCSTAAIFQRFCPSG